MKTHLSQLLLALHLPLLLNAEDASLPTTGTYAPDSLRVPVFTPPAPFVPKEPLADAQTTIVLRDHEGKIVTLQRGEASLAPDLPAPEPAQEAFQRPPFENPRPQVLQINMSGTVYDRRVTVVRWQHAVSNEPYEAVLGFDLGLVANLGSFVYEGIPCHSNIFCMQLETQRPVAQRSAARRFPPVSVPAVEADSYRILKGNAEDAAGMTPLLAVQAIYLAEKPRLEKLSSDLKNYQQEAKAWAEANPTPVEPAVFWFKPHRNSRYLTPVDKARQQAAQDQNTQATQGEAR